MKRAAAQFGVTLALLMVLGCDRAMAQTPPSEPSDFSTYFVGFDFLTLPHSTVPGAVSLDGEGFSNFGFWFRGIPGAVTGDFFEDYTNKRERFDIGTTDPKSPTPIATIWKFYDKNKIYLLRHATSKCTESSFQATLIPFFRDLANSSFESQTGFAETIWFAGTQEPLVLPGNVWTYPLSRGNSLGFGTDASATEFPLYVTRYAPGRIARLQFMLFTSGQPDASVFSLPAACAGP